MKMLKAVITGDVINSRDEEPSVWMPILKAILETYGNTPKNWEVFRGDSFQLVIDASEALHVAFHIKSGLKTIRGLDARISLGLGDETYSSDRVSESNGPAYQLSGNAFDSIRKNTLVVNSVNERFNRRMNVALNLAVIVANSWTPTEAEVIRYKLENPNVRQADIAKSLGKTQGPVSLALNRGGFHEIMNLIDLFREEIEYLWNGNSN